MAANIKMLSNLESLGDLVGSLAGISDSLDESAYMEDIIRAAHGRAQKSFDLAAAAKAQTGSLQHVFEFGTAGITRGPAKFSDPTSESARLWKHTLVGRGGSMNIGYSFRPAIARNPQPTTAYTGVASKYLRRLSKRKYVFWNKAFVMETGQTVEIHPKNGEYLFVPFYGKESRDPKNKKGFVMTKRSVTAIPGKTVKGTFSSFWLLWWASVGSKEMEKDMRSQIVSDIAREENLMIREANSSNLKEPAATKITGMSKSARARTRKRFGRRK